MTITGHYSRTGYRIELNGQPIYTAGNHCLESQGHAMVGSLEALPLRKLRSYCNSTARDMAKENSADFGGVEREEEER